MPKILFRECVEALNAEVLPNEQSAKVTKLLAQMYPITEWGKIDWDKIPMSQYVGNDPNEILPALSRLLKVSFDRSVYIDWSDGDLPVIKTDLDLVIKYFDDVACVTFEKFIFNPFEGYMVEVRPGRNITVGVLPSLRNEVA